MMTYREMTRVLGKMLEKWQGDSTQMRNWLTMIWVQMVCFDMRTRGYARLVGVSYAAYEIIQNHQTCGVRM